jgi:uncharacterized protein
VIAGLMVITRILYKITKFKSERISLNGKRMRMYIADSFARQSVGLMYRKPLKKDEGMLFVFSNEERWGIWMLNMRFSIDIIWLDGSGKVIHMKRGALPCTSIFSCEVYKPERPAKYVLEVNEGISSKYKLSVGSIIKLPDGIRSG